MDEPRLTNRHLAELLSRAAASGEASDHGRRALRRAARAAFLWLEEAADLLAQGRPLTELRFVGPWLAGMIGNWLAENAEVPTPPPIRQGFETATAANARLAAVPELAAALRGDLQIHTTDSDGTASLAEMARAAAARGHEYLAITDHSKGLKIAHGMDEERLAHQGEEIARVNDELAAEGARLRVLRAIEMNLSPDGAGDMDPAALGRLDLVLGALHSRLRVTEDQTERYVAALRNPTHPRPGAPARTDLRLQGRAARRLAVRLRGCRRGGSCARDRRVSRPPGSRRRPARARREAGVRISIGSDAHAPHQLAFVTLGVAAALQAGIPPERILNFMPRDELLAWARRDRR